MTGWATAGEALKTATASLAAAGIENPRREARLLAEHVLGQDGGDRLSLFTRPERPLTPDEQERLSRVVARRAAHEPFSRIVGVREFWSLPFWLSPDTLDPRPDSETLVQAALDAIPDRQAPLRALDLGTGSGCLLLALLSELPNAWGLGIDISPGAAATAALNARALGLADRASFLVADWTDAIDARFDMVLVNPPYILTGAAQSLETEVALWDPHGALFAGADGLDAVRALAPKLPQIISDQGFIVAELGAGQDEAAAQLYAGQGLETVARLPDLSGLTRCLLMRFTKST